MEDTNMGNQMKMLSKIAAVLLLAAALTGGAFAGCSSCGGGPATGWMGASSMGISWAGELSSMGTTTSSTGSSTTTGNDSDGAEGGADGLDGAASRLSPEALFADQNGERRLAVAYAGVPGEASYIEGAIHLPLDQVFAEDGSLKSPAEIAAIFGAAGIAEEDPLVIYSDSFFNGFDTFAFWVMKYLGHQELLLLEGTRASREAAGLNFVAAPAVRTAEAYNPSPSLDLLIVEGEISDLQIVDARSPEEYSAGHLEGAMNIDSSKVMGAEGLADDQALTEAFSSLDKDVPVVVYSTKGGVASMVWYALLDQGFTPRMMISAGSAA